MQENETIQTGVAAVLFCAIFLFGGHIYLLQPVFRDRRDLISLGAGMSCAYVFVHVMPEMNAMANVLVHSTAIRVRFEGLGVYFLGLLGFLVFYGLHHLRRESKSEAGDSELGLRVNLGGFALYAWLASYLLVNKLDEKAGAKWLFAIAMAFHFLTVDHSLRNDYGNRYDRVGRYWLAGMCALGWATGMMFVLPREIVALLIAFLSGAIIINSASMELPADSGGRYWPFLLGGIGYAAILLFV